MKNKRETLGRRLKALRVKYDVVHRELSEATGLMPKAISAIERDHAVPNLCTLCRIADAFEIEPWDFIKGLDIPRHSPPPPPKRKGRVR